MERILWILSAFLIGAMLPIQAGLNTKLGKVAGNPTFGALISFVVGTVGLLIYFFLTKSSVSWAEVKEQSFTLWLGGVIGAIYVAGVILLFPKLGPGMVFGLIVAGQMLMSMWLEHKNILVASPSAINPMKVLGILLVIGGVIIIRKYS